MMKQQNLWAWPALLILGLSALSLTSCSDDDDTAAAAPTITLSETSFSGKVDEVATTTVSAMADAGIKEVRVVKYIGDQIDQNFGTNGTQILSSTPAEVSYTLAGEGAETPIRFQFVVEDNQGRTDDANWVITTELTLAYVLTNFDWRWENKLGKLFSEGEDETEQIVDCEKDNVYSFNEDGTMTLDYGELTGSGGGTCDFDGLAPAMRYEIAEDESTLTIISVNAFDPSDERSEVLMIDSYNLTDLVTKTTVDLTAFGGIVYDWTYSFKAQPK